ncbi:hypothetical protein [Sphingomonas sp. KC8]|uniref:hypothetical protein n=1 Tax=Sphingomonas sp. KC8 TaxID=1030157 RepID=UPI000248A7DA|nr:hypothetical protein [Sphingomonas sp. KC8]ARS27585.1 hypothetical protein KC8_09800 [Sphingomonas sp. KC8]
MPQDEPGLTGDDEALSAWETGAGDTPDVPPHSKLAALKSRFDNHADVCALRDALNAAMNDGAAPVPVTVAVQPGLLALLAHVERIDSARADRAEASPSAVLAQAINNYLENLLHTLVADPTSHPHFAELWNSLCADANAPELAVPTDENPEPATPADGGPF